MMNLDPDRLVNALRIASRASVCREFQLTIASGETGDEFPMLSLVEVGIV